LVIAITASAQTAPNRVLWIQHLVQVAFLRLMQAREARHERATRPA